MSKASIPEFTKRSAFSSDSDGIAQAKFDLGRGFGQSSGLLTFLKGFGVFLRDAF
jgi:hypothetical protein